MKFFTTAFALALLLGAGTTAADELSTEQRIEYCSKLAEVAKGYMEMRQLNFELSAVLAHVTEHWKDTPWYDLKVDIATTAYQYPMMSLQENKADIAVEYASEVLVMCMESI